MPIIDIFFLFSFKYGILRHVFKIAFIQRPSESRKPTRNALLQFLTGFLHHIQSLNTAIGERRKSEICDAGYIGGK